MENINVMMTPYLDEVNDIIEYESVDKLLEITAERLIKSKVDYEIILFIIAAMTVLVVDYERSKNGGDL